MNTRSTVIGIVVLIVLIGSFVVIRSRESSVAIPVDSTLGTDMDGMEATASSTMDVDASTTVSATLDTTKVKEFTVTGSNFAFAPSTLAVNKGDTVTIHFKNSGGFHDFKIDELGVATPRINGGQNADVTFVATTTGTFEYYCSVGTHRQMGMKGTLTVK
jgi:plastocyanin